MDSTSVSVLREMMQPLWSMMEKQGLPKETQEFLTFIMEEGGRWGDESQKLAEMRAKLDIEEAKLEGRREEMAKVMEAFLNIFKKHAPATTPD